jgi:hypothetical protein
VDEYVVITRSGEILAGPFASEHAARWWISNTGEGQAAVSRWGELFVASFRPVSAASCDAPDTPLCVFNDRSEVPRAVWELQGSGDLIAVEMPYGFIAVFPIG